MRFGVHHAIITFLMLSNVCLFLYLGLLNNERVLEGYFPPTELTKGAEGGNRRAKFSPKIRPRLKTDDENNARCVHMDFSEVPLPLTALASFPGAGNTWLRYLVEQLTGIYTGSMYKDQSLAKRFPGEGSQGRSVIAVKTHANMEDEQGKPQFERAVILLRSPYDCILAEYNRQNNGHTGKAHGFGKKWRTFRDDYIDYWHAQHMVWLQNDVPDLLFLSFRDLRTDLRPQLLRLASFLHVESLSEEHIQCVLDHSEGHFRRKNHVDPTNLDLYDDDAIRKIETKRMEIEDVLVRKFGVTVHW